MAGKTRLLRLLGAALAAVLVVSSGAPNHMAAASTPTDQVFVDPQAGADPLVAFINQAQRTLDGEVYLASSKPVLSALEADAVRGVQVRINLEQHPYGTGSAVPTLVYQSLAAHKVQVRWTSRTFTYTHAKYLVEDNARAWIGTMNWTTSAFKSNREFGVLDTDPTVVSQAEAVFAADWDHKQFTGSASALVLSPVNSRTSIDALIASAHKAMDIYAEEVNDRDQEQAIIAAVKRGVHVRLVCTGTGDVSLLQQAGVQVVIKKSPYIHAKAFVVDGSAVFLGSENISSTSLDKNREMGLILHDGAAITAVEQAFAADVGGAPMLVSSTGGSTTTTAPATPTAGSTITGPFAVIVTVAPNPTRDGTPTTVTGQTTTGAQCTVRVVYASGAASGSAALKTTQTAGSNGTVSWTWKPSTRTPGQATATVTCTYQGKSATSNASFTVQ